ncbi:RnfH family protein [Nitrosomonas sp. HPC101]|uniref:RnfH family protein n=1 Tax=Nitrosomonas sp. HPC101 TaxID=1658667 RepID=UPI001370610D|nr:RnfH family protein [Nitrosomonas sp. HPC101]MXS85007.1 RnfH family protein [Nitrosomonas sp. HPC101]
MGLALRNGFISIEIVAALTGRHFTKRLQVPEGTMIKQAIKFSEIKEFYPVINWSTLKIGIHGKIVHPETILHQNDRIEIYRPLIVDPKEKRKLKIKSK